MTPKLTIIGLLSLFTVGSAVRSIAAEEETEPDSGWAFSASAYTYLVPHDDDYVQPTFTVDHDWLHLEARYNYEDQDTASLWGGYNLSGVEEEITWEITPMLGVVFGDTDGLAPGYKGSIGWKSLELYSEGEYVIDGHDASDSFFYNWSELTVSPFDWCRFGLVTQRTRAYDTDREVQRGLLLGFAFKRVDATAYVLNPDDDDPVWVFSVGLSL